MCKRTAYSAVLLWKELHRLPRDGAVRLGTAAEPIRRLVTSASRMPHTLNDKIVTNGYQMPRTESKARMKALQGTLVKVMRC